MRILRFGFIQNCFLIFSRNKVDREKYLTWFLLFTVKQLYIGSLDNLS
jgi:hypothetical protein